MLVQMAIVLALAGSIAMAVSGDRASADTYTIQRGDTLWGIANELQIGVSVLLALNAEITSPDSIFVGQQIQVPDNTLGGGSSSRSSRSSSPSSIGETTGPTFDYTIQRGDTLSEIALTYGTTIEIILALNPSLDPNLLFVGTQITVLRRNGATPPAQSGGTQQPALNAGIVTTTPAPTNTVTREHVVQSGEGLYAIAQNAGLSIEELLQYNPGIELSTVIHPGDIIYIPTPDYHAPAIDPEHANHAITTQYAVRAGDNATLIAERFDISLDELAALNFGVNLSRIYVGQELTVPWSQAAVNAAAGTAPAVEQRRRTYEVQRGDTFSDIAERHGITLDELRALNPLRSTDLLVIGQLLYLPGFIDLPVVSEERTLSESDLVQYAAAKLGVTPHTLLANHAWLEPGQWLEAGSSWRVPVREGIIVTVQRGDTLQAIADRYGVDMLAILDDPAHGVQDANEIVIGQEIILPLSIPEFVWPATGTITDRFGLCRSWDCSYRHKGLDVALDMYEPILAAADGVVTFVGGDADLGLGWYIEVDHGEGWSTVYAHLVEFAVWQGQAVNAGDLIGYNGNTGHSTGPHLHLEVRHYDWYVDPLVVLP